MPLNIRVQTRIELQHQIQSSTPDLLGARSFEAPRFPHDHARLPTTSITNSPSDVDEACSIDLSHGTVRCDIYCTEIL